MMQTAEVRDELDLAVSSDCSREWRVFTKGQVRAGAVVVVCTVMGYATQMRFAPTPTSAGPLAKASKTRRDFHTGNTIMIVIGAGRYPPR